MPKRSKKCGRNNILSEGLRKLRQSDPGIERIIAPRSDEIISLLEKYIAQIELFNPAYSLVGTSDRQELITRHILDSLAPLGIIYRLLENCTGQIADVGSGAGLPGIPLAISLPHINFTLIERKGRRADFLRNTRADLNLFNTTVEEAEMEKAPPGRFSLVVFRALHPLEPKILKKLFRLCSEGGVLAAYKGRRSKIEEETAALQDLTGGMEVIPCPVPFLDEERHLVVMKRP